MNGDLPSTSQYQASTPKAPRPRRKRSAAMIPVHAAQERNTRNAAGLTNQRRGAHRRVTVFELVGVLFLQRLPRDFRIHDKDGALIGGIEHKRTRRIWGRFRIEYVEAIAHIYLRFEMRRLEVIVANLEHFPEGEIRIISMPRQIRRRHAERISLDLE